jgi:UDP-glucose 4-epimerase
MLLEQNHQVIHYNRGNAKDLFPEVQTLIGDRTDRVAFRNLLHKQSFDCVIDMVCYKPEEVSSAVDIFQGQVGQYIFCSTVDVYTKPSAQYPITEDAPRQPRILAMLTIKPSVKTFSLEPISNMAFL